jgi:hypothetical protein
LSSYGFIGDKRPTDMSVPETSIDRCRALPSG